MIRVAHRFGIRIYFDNVMNHNAFDIPGFNADTPIDVYPGLVPEDFHLRVTEEGRIPSNDFFVRAVGSVESVEDFEFVLGGEDDHFALAAEAVNLVVDDDRGRVGFTGDALVPEFLAVGGIDAGDLPTIVEEEHQLPVTDTGRDVGDVFGKGENFRGLLPVHLDPNRFAAPSAITS